MLIELSCVHEVLWVEFEIKLSDLPVLGRNRATYRGTNSLVTLNTIINDQQRFACELVCKAAACYLHCHARVDNSQHFHKEC